MQNIQFKNKINECFQDLISLYPLYTDCQLELNLEQSINNNLKEMIDILSVPDGREYKFNFCEKKYDIQFNQQDSSCVVCLSGGKDSTACAMWAKEHYKNVYLYTIKGLNKSYPEEVERAKNIANLLNLPIYIDEVKLTGKSEFADHPFKNQLIGCCAVNYCINNNIQPNIVFGDFKNDTMNNASYYTTWSDCFEMWRSFNKYMKFIIKDYNLIMPFENEISSLKKVTENIDIYRATQGCISPIRFRQQLRNLNMDKYKIELFDNKCGSCYKCCREYIYLMDNEIIPFNKDFYKHCLDIFKKTFKKKFPNKTVPKDPKELYEFFVKIDSSNSIYFKEVR